MSETTRLHNYTETAYRYRLLVTVSSAALLAMRSRKASRCSAIKRIIRLSGDRSWRNAGFDRKMEYTAE